MKNLICVLAILWGGGGLLVQAQTPYRQALSLELAGKSILFASISYERYFEDDRFGIGGGLGFTALGSGGVSRQIDGMIQNGRYTELVFPVLLYGIGSFGNGAHRLHTQLGVNWQQRLDFQRYPEGNTTFYESGLLPYLGVGYEYRGEKVFFRALPMIGYVGDSSGFLPPVVPWLGLTVGVPW